MLISNQKYVDPSLLVHSVVDEMGKKIAVGNEMDATEYLLNLLERIEEGVDEVPNKNASATKSEQDTQTETDSALSMNQNPLF